MRLAQHRSCDGHSPAFRRATAAEPSLLAATQVDEWKSNHRRAGRSHERLGTGLHCGRKFPMRSHALAIYRRSRGVHRDGASGHFRRWDRASDDGSALSGAFWIIPTAIGGTDSGQPLGPNASDGGRPRPIRAVHHGRGAADGGHDRPYLSGKRPRKWTSQGPPAAVGERYLTAGLGWPLGCTWPTAKAFAFLYVDSTRRSETGQVWGLRWHNRPREWKGKEW